MTASARRPVSTSAASPHRPRYRPGRQRRAWHRHLCWYSGALQRPSPAGMASVARPRGRAEARVGQALACRGVRDRFDCSASARRPTDIVAVRCRRGLWRAAKHSRPPSITDGPGHGRGSRRTGGGRGRTAGARYRWRRLHGALLRARGAHRGRVDDRAAVAEGSGRGDG